MTIQQHASFDSSAAELNATSKLVKAWESKNAKNAAKAGGISLMALSLAACGGSSTTTTTPVVDTPVVDTPVVDTSTVTPVAVALTGENDIFDANDFTTAADAISADQDTYESADVIAEPNAGDGDTLTITTDADITATPTIVGVENIVVNSSQFAGASDGIDFAATGISGGTLTLNNVQVGSLDDSATVTGAGNITVIAGANVTDTIDVTMTAAASTVVNAGEAGTVVVTAGAATDTITVVYNGDAGSTLDVATTANISATVASTVTLTGAEELTTITADANVTIDLADLSGFDGATITGAAAVVGAGALITEDLTGISAPITFDADSAGAVADGATITIDGTSGTDLVLDTDDGDDDVDSEASITIVINEADTTANTVTLDVDGFGDDTITTVNLVSSVAQGANNAFVLHSNATAITTNVSGAAALSIDTTDLDGTLNASAMTGALTATAHSELLTITGGAGDDVITSDDAEDWVLDGGDGDSDRLVIDGDSRGGTFSNFEILTIGDDDEFLASQLGGETLVVQAINGSISIDEASSIDVSTIDMSGLTAARAADDIDIDLGQIDASLILSGQAITYTGWNGVDTVAAGANGDTISTGAGADVITGGAGADTITGGEGADTITGGAGADTIVLTETTSAVDTVLYALQTEGSGVGTVGGTFSGFDTITGFTVGADLIDLETNVTAASEVWASTAATTVANDLSDDEYNDVDAVTAFLADIAANETSVVDTNALTTVAITFSDFTAVYVIDNDDTSDPAVGEIELLAVVENAILTSTELT